MGTRKTALTPLANSADEGSSTDLLYQLHARDYFAATVMADMSATYGRFLTELAPGSRILDAGCGSGRDLKHFLSKGFKPTGIDAASALVALAAEFSEAPCFVMRIEDLCTASRESGLARRSCTCRSRCSEGCLPSLNGHSYRAAPCLHLSGSALVNR
jgi:SAM-dependent methyltransferase